MNQPVINTIFWLITGWFFYWFLQACVIKCFSSFLNLPLCQIILPKINCLDLEKLNQNTNTKTYNYETASFFL